MENESTGDEEYASVDSELDHLNPSDAVRAAFERRRPGMADTPDESPS